MAIDPLTGLPKKKRTRRGTRGGRNRKRPPVGDGTAALNEAAEDANAGGRRAGRGRRRAGTSFSARAAVENAVEPEAESGETRGGRRRDDDGAPVIHLPDPVARHRRRPARCASAPGGAAEAAGTGGRSRRAPPRTARSLSIGQVGRRDRVEDTSSSWTTSRSRTPSRSSRSSRTTQSSRTRLLPRTRLSLKRLLSKRPSLKRTLSKSLSSRRACSSSEPVAEDAADGRSCSRRRSSRRRVDVHADVRLGPGRSALGVGTLPFVAGLACDFLR